MEIKNKLNDRANSMIFEDESRFRQINSSIKLSKTQQEN